MNAYMSLGVCSCVYVCLHVHVGARLYVCE